MTKYDIRHTSDRENVFDMPAPRTEPHTKVCVSLADRVLERLDQYPGERSWKIEMLLQIPFTTLLH